MLKMLMIADDFTGALDTGIQFAQYGIVTAVVNGLDYDFSPVNDVQLVVVNSATRHLRPEEAYKIVYQITKRAVDRGVPIIYKKTDSALRGCVGSELTAVLDACGVEALHFVPALPKAGRITAGGVQYLNGVPIHKTVFGRDPFEPVPCSHIPSLIAMQSNTRCISLSAGEKPPPPKDGEGVIFVYDAKTEEDLLTAAITARDNGGLRILGGCAGLASVLPDLIDFTRSRGFKPAKTSGLFIVSGSLNPITAAQLDYAREQGFRQVHLTIEQKLLPGYLDSSEGKAFLQKLRMLCTLSPAVMLDIFNEEGLEACDRFAEKLGMNQDEARERIAARLGEITAAWLEFGLDHTILMSGGDTLLGFMNTTGRGELQPICEVAQGAVLSRLKLGGRTVQIISKSGGFGVASTLADIAALLIDSDIGKEQVGN